MFGALDEASWLRATLASVLYGLVLRRRGNVSDAIVAHATTNLLVLLYAWVQHDWGILG
jgi:membrane protease YdiL (CAAX protease family)